MPERGGYREALTDQDVKVIASCPEWCHDQMTDICSCRPLVKAFGKKGDYLDDLDGSEWYAKWQARVVQAVTTSVQLRPECKQVKIICIEGGPHCDREYAKIPDLKKAVCREMEQLKRKVRVKCEWMSWEDFQTEEELLQEDQPGHPLGISNQEDLEDPAEVAADEAAAARRDDITDAAVHGDLPAVCGFLRRDPGSVKEKNSSYGNTALHLAADRGHAAVVEFLLSKKADIDAVNIYSETPLHNAAYSGRVDCVRILLPAGARTDLKNRHGKTALEDAKNRGHDEIVSLLTGHEDPAEVAADEAAAEKCPNILEAARRGDLAAARGWVRRDPKIVEEDRDGDGYRTALHLAAACGHATVVDFLLSKKADVDALNIYSQTPLMHAADGGEVDCVRILLAAGARTDIKNRHGKTALDYAKSNGRKEIVSLLDESEVQSRFDARTSQNNAR
eukprot:s250_g19.t1